MSRPEKKEINVTKTYLPPMEEYVSRLQGIWETGWITNSGALEVELTQKLKEYLGVEHIELVSNGTLAIQLAIKVLELKGEIITTPFTYVATSTAIVWEGCTPVFMDIDENSLCINPELIESAITEKTSAILATHVYGNPCDVERIQQIADKHKLKVIYDAAHCFGVRLKGKSILNFGDISTLSFHATKIFHTAEGGAVICRNEDLLRKCYLMKKFGHVGEDEYEIVGINAKLSELHAAMGLCVLPEVPNRIGKRKQLAHLYDELIKDETIQRPKMDLDLEHNYSYYPVIFPSHESMMRVREALLENSIAPRRYFYPSLNTIPYLQLAGYQPCPVSESVANRVLCLPIYNDLQIDDIAGISQIIMENI